jgi:methyltransferase (TIGR00027 family)
MPLLSLCFRVSVVDFFVMREISETALWVAVYRARENERPDAAFRDPYARLLAGERGEEFAKSMGFGEQNEWSFLGRTHLFDKYIAQEISKGADLVLNLACGLDTRPYRMSLPGALRWVEVDLPELLEYKEEILTKANARPVCSLERVALDLSDVPRRRELFARLARECRLALIVTEGLLVYLSREENATLAADLAAEATFRRWILDMSSPGLLKMMHQHMGDKFEAHPLKFAPEEGLAFYEAHGWKRQAVQSLPEGAEEINRVPDWLKPMVHMPVPDPPGDAIWGGMALMSRT